MRGGVAVGCDWASRVAYAHRDRQPNAYANPYMDAYPHGGAHANANGDAYSHADANSRHGA